MRIFFPNARIAHPPTRGRDIHRFQLIKNLTELGNEVHSLLPDDNPHTRKHRRGPLSVLHLLRHADVLYCRIDYGPNSATDLTLPRTRWLIPSHCVVVWEFNVSLEYSPLEERPIDEVERAIARLRQAAGRVDLAICVTKQLADEARNQLGIRNAQVVQNGSDPEMFRRNLPRPAQLQLRNDRLNVTFIASGPNPYHDTPLIRDAASLADREEWPIDFHILGASESLFGADVPRNLHHHGAISYLELPKYLAAMDVGLVLYQRYADGLSPLKLFDYMAAGCVPICSPSQPMREVLDGTNAGLIRQWDAASLCSELMALHGDRSRLEQFRAAARQLILEKHSWRRVAEKTIELIQQAGQLPA
jgi:glycosyltransferase involved in cell wall biosynthesis